VCVCVCVCVRGTQLRERLFVRVIGPRAGPRRRDGQTK